MFQEIINSAFQDIVSDELKKIEDSHDILWEYEGPEDAYEGDSEEILLEMQHMFYNDLISETTINGKPFTLSLLPIWRSWILMHCCGYLLLLPGSYAQAETWDEEEDEYLATLVSQNMLLNTEQVGFLSPRILVFPNLARQLHWCDVFVRSQTRYGVRSASKARLWRITDISIALCVKCS